MVEGYVGTSLAPGSQRRSARVHVSINISCSRCDCTTQMTAELEVQPAWNAEPQLRHTHWFCSFYSPHQQIAAMFPPPPP